MSQLNTVMAIFAVVAAAGIIGTVGVFLTTGFNQRMLGIPFLQAKRNVQTS